MADIAKTATSFAGTIWKKAPLMVTFATVAGLAFAAPGTTAALAAGVGNFGGTALEIAKAGFDGAVAAGAAAPVTP